MVCDDGRSPVILASAEGHVEVVRLLASAAGHVEVVRLLLEAGANGNLADSSGTTALMLASATGRVELVRLLLEAGADRNLVNEDGLTALMIASAKGDVEVTRSLQAAGVGADTESRKRQHSFSDAGIAKGQRQGPTLADGRDRGPSKWEGSNPIASHLAAE